MRSLGFDSGDIDKIAGSGGEKTVLKEQMGSQKD